MDPARRAALALLVAGTCATACTDGGNASSTPAPQELVVGISDAESFDRCPAISARRVERQAVAFSGTLDIRAPDGTDWVFRVDHWYAGGGKERPDVVVVRGSDVTIAYLQSTVHGLEDPDEGGLYLVAGSKRAASACLIEPWSQELAETYAAAFPDPQG